MTTAREGYVRWRRQTFCGDGLNVSTWHTPVPHLRKVVFTSNPGLVTTHTGL
jgi:hypothetical protein